MMCRKCNEQGTEKQCPKCEVRRKYQGRIFHDLRRTSARDLIRSGVGESVAMCITGHKTNSMFKRYNITDSEDVRKAMQSVARYREKQQKKVVQMEASR
jgi:integrase